MERRDGERGRDASGGDADSDGFTSLGGTAGADEPSRRLNVAVDHLATVGRLIQIWLAPMACFDNLVSMERPARSASCVDQPP